MAARSSKNLAQEVARLFQAAAEGVYALDEEGRIIFVNGALENWLGQEGSTFLGSRCAYAPVAHESIGSAPTANHGASPAEDGVAEHGALVGQDAAPHRPLAPEEIAAALCPPPEVLQGVRRAGRLICPRSASERRVEFFPLTGEMENCIGVLAIVAPRDLSDLESLDAAASYANGDSAELHERLMRFRRQWRRRFQLGRIIGDSPEIRRVRSQISLAALGSAHVLVVGPSGSGRKHIARAIHALADPNAEHPLPILKCDFWNAEQFSALWQSLIQRGSVARGGSPPDPTPSRGTSIATVLLSDVDRLTLDAQAELSRCLNGASHAVRVIATASNAPPETSTDKSGSNPALRADLACLLGTLTIQLLPLAERMEDLPLLAQAFLEEQNGLGRKQISRFSGDAIESLAAYAWPGNIAELAAAVAESHRNADGPFVEVGDLPKRIRLALDANARAKKSPRPIQLPDILNQVEAELIRRALSQCKRNKSKAAELLGISRQQLHRRMVQLDLE